MTSIIFDPDARAEFLSDVQYYENCQPGLGRRFRLVVESAVQDITKTPFRFYIVAVAHTKRKPGYWLREPLTQNSSEAVT